jgi:integrase
MAQMGKANFGKAIFLRGDTYWIRYSHKGQQQRESARTKNYQEAERYYKRRLGELVTGRYAGLAVERITFAELADAVVEDYILNAKRSLPETKMRLKKHLLPAFGKLRAAEFGTTDLNRYIKTRLKAGAANATVNRELAIVSRAFSLAAEHDPPKVARILHIPHLKEDNVRTGFLEEDQYQSLLQHLPEEIRPVLMALYHWGNRISELKSMLFPQVDLRGLEVRLNPGTTKNGEGRVLPIYGDLTEWFLMAKEIRDRHYPQCPWVFHRRGEQIKNFRKSWAAACTAAAVPGLRPHDLRRTAVRLMSRAGQMDKVAMQVTGHKTFEIYQRYNIVSNRDLTQFRERQNVYREQQKRDCEREEAPGTTSTIASTTMVPKISVRKEIDA